MIEKALVSVLLRRPSKNGAVSLAITEDRQPKERLLGSEWQIGTFASKRVECYSHISLLLVHLLNGMACRLSREMEMQPHDILLNAKRNCRAVHPL